MQIEFYQILVPLVGLAFIVSLVRKFRRSQLSPQVAFGGTIVWLVLIALAIFPDFFSKKAAEVFGIKNNVNAVIFICLGALFFFQYQLFFMFKRQEAELTRLIRELSLHEYEKRVPK